MNYEELLIEADNQQLIAREKPLNANAGRIKGNRIAIRRDLPTQAEKACVLAEELGHYHTTSGDILDQSDVSNRKQEQRARIWAYNKQIGLRGIIDCYKANYFTIYEMAEYLGVTEQFLTDALSCYKNKYGVYTTVDNYIVGFEPNLYVLEKFE